MQDIDRNLAGDSNHDIKYTVYEEEKFNDFSNEIF